MRLRLALAIVLGSSTFGAAQSLPQPDWSTVEEETLRHFQALVQLDTSNPPGNEQRAVAYLKQVLDREGIPSQVFALDPNRSNLVARLKGNGRKRPLLIMSHTDVVTVDASKWRHPPFSAAREGGYIYGRGTVDDKDNLAAALMTILLLNRLKVPLDRDVILLAESGEEGTTRVGIQFMVNQHFSDIDAEYCLAEGAGVTRIGGQVRYASVQTMEKVPRAVELVARGVSGHGSMPLKSNAVVHLAAAVAKLGTWRPEIRLNETTSTHFRRLAMVSPPEIAKHYLDVLSSDVRRRAAADDWLFENEPRHSSMLRTSISPNIVSGGYRSNVIPSEAKATLDVRALPDEDPDRLLETIKKVVDDPAVEVRFVQEDIRPSGAEMRLDSEAYLAIEAANRRVYDTMTLPMMTPQATDMAYLRAKGIQCFGIGPAIDFEDGGRGFGAHSDQERILESELHRFVRLNWDVTTSLAAAR
jgi:acetylornithine deacetylase/succinyl-diaminopimelate desuccinylase-like protein